MKTVKSVKDRNANADTRYSHTFGYKAKTKLLGCEGAGLEGANGCGLSCGKIAEFIYG